MEETIKHMIAQARGPKKVNGQIGQMRVMPKAYYEEKKDCLLYTSPSPRDRG